MFIECTHGSALLHRFDVVSGRAGLKEAIQTCSLTAFRRYSSELEEMQTICERNRVCVCVCVCVCVRACMCVAHLHVQPHPRPLSINEYH